MPDAAQPSRSPSSPNASSGPAAPAHRDPASAARRAAQARKRGGEVVGVGAADRDLRQQPAVGVVGRAGDMAVGARRRPRLGPRPAHRPELVARALEQPAHAGDPRERRAGRGRGLRHARGRAEPAEVDVDLAQPRIRGRQPEVLRAADRDRRSVLAAHRERADPLGGAHGARSGRRGTRTRASSATPAIEAFVPRLSGRGAPPSA